MIKQGALPILTHVIKLLYIYIFLADYSLMNISSEPYRNNLVAFWGHPGNYYPTESLTICSLFLYYFGCRRFCWIYMIFLKYIYLNSQYPIIFFFLFILEIGKIKIRMKPLNAPLNIGDSVGSSTKKLGGVWLTPSGYAN